MQQFRLCFHHKAPDRASDEQKKVRHACAWHLTIPKYVKSQTVNGLAWCCFKDNKSKSWGDAVHLDLKVSRPQQDHAKVCVCR